MRETTSKLKAIVTMLMLLAVFAFSAVFMTACNSECQHENLQKHDANAATCSAEGNSEYWTCPDCDKIFADEAGEEELSAVPTISALGHEWEETWQNDENGHWHKCKNCDTLSSSDPHTVVEIGEAKDPTCTEAGVTAGEKCSVCGYVIEEQTAVAALGHDLARVEAKTATCSAAGNIEHWYCAYCDSYFKDADATQSCTQADTVIAIDPAAHTFGDLQSAKAATCTEAGNVEYKDCVYCGKHFAADGTEIEGEVTIAALGHSYDAITIATRPAKLVYIAGEDFSAEGMVVQATCTRDGCNAITTISDYTLVGAEGLTKGAQTVTVKWTFGETELSADVSVSVYEEVEIAEELDFSLESESSSVTVTLEGTVERVTSGTAEVTEGITYTEGTLTFTKSALNTLLNGSAYAEDLTLNIYTSADKKYVVTANIATMFIDEAQDLADITAANTAAMIDAYYIVTADIDASTSGTVNFVNPSDKLLNSSTEIGFKGIFDGRGHIISNITTDSGYARLGGVFGQLMTGSVVKNIAFVNVTATDQGVVLVGEGTKLLGTIENVVVVGAENGGCKRVVASMTGGVMKNCLFVNVEQISVDSNGTQVSNVMSVTTGENHAYGGFSWTGNNTYNAQPNYASVNAMFEALAEENLLTNWGSITYSDGVISFNDKEILKPVVNVSFDNESREIQRGTSLTFTTDGYVTLSLKESTDGVSIADNVLTVAATVAEKTQIAVVATSTLNESVTAEYTFTVIRSYEEVEIAEELDFSLESESSSVTVTLEGTVERVTSGTAEVTEGITYTEGTLTFTKSALNTLLNGSAYAEDLTLNIYTSADKKYVVTANIATMFIDEAQDLADITAANTAAMIDAYYIVTADIDASTSGTVNFVNPSDKLLNSSTEIGFKGIFDGRGHIISNITTDSGYARLGGVFGQLMTGSVVKNIAFVNVTATDQGVVLVGEGTKLLGTIENVVVVGAENGGCKRVVASMTGGVMKNCLFVNVEQISVDSNGTQVSNVMSVTTGENHAYGGFSWTGNNTYNAQPNYASVNAMFEALAEENLLTDWGGITYSGGTIKFYDTVILTAEASETTGEVVSE